MKLSFVIPVYNEDQSLKQLYSEIIENTSNMKYEIIFVDDGSTDNSFNIMQELAKKDKNVKIRCHYGRYYFYNGCRPAGRCERNSKLFEEAG